MPTTGAWRRCSTARTSRRARGPSRRSASPSGRGARLARAWQTLAREETPDGVLELRRRGSDDFLITLDGRVLMTSAASRSEQALAAEALARLPRRRAPAVLLGGLGMGFTLRAALDGLPPRARVQVAELYPVVARWCRGPLADLTAAAVDDPRVSVEIGDVAAAIERGGPWDLIALDLFEGPRRERSDPHFGDAALRRAFAALRPGGVLAVWCERPEPAFERRLRAAGFAVERRRAGRGGLRHAIAIGIRESDTPGGRRRGPAAHRRS